MFLNSLKVLEKYWIPLSGLEKSSKLIYTLSTPHCFLWNRGYYMAAWRYEIPLRLLKNISRVSAANEWNIFSTREEKFCISKRPCNVLFYYINTNELPNHFTLIVFWCERRDLLCSHSNGDIFTCEDHMLFSHVKISNFHAKLTWYFIGVYIIN